MAKRRKASKKQTLNEFKAWLEGVEELQADNWAPDKGQWDKIRARIENIIMDAPAVVTNTVETGRPMGPTRMAPIPGYVPPPIVPSSIPMPPADVEMSAAAREMLSGSSGKTPDVDASEGGVPSSFE